MRIGRAMTAIAAALVGAGLLTSPARAATTPTQTVAVTIGQGNAITVSGTGWVTQAGAQGSIVGIKLDDGALARTYDLNWPAATTADAAFRANTTIWGVAQADATGKWSVSLPYPSAANTGSSLAKWTVGSTHSVRLLSGSLLTGDVVRTAKVSFTVGANSATATTVTPTAVTQKYGSAAGLAVSVSPATATGTVSVPVGSTTVSAAVSGGKATLTIPARALAVGSWKPLVTYSGASGYRPASATGSITVAKATPTVTVKPAAASVKRGSVATFTVTVAATGVTPTGTVTVAVASTTGTAALSGGAATVRVTIPAGASTGLKGVTASYSGDASVAAGTGGSSITVTG